MSLRNSELLSLSFLCKEYWQARSLSESPYCEHKKKKKKAAHAGLLVVVCPHYTYCNFSLFGVGWTDYHYH